VPIATTTWHVIRSDLAVGILIIEMECEVIVHDERDGISSVHATTNPMGACLEEPDNHLQISLRQHRQ
jgi:hypothetical protein